MRSDDMFAELDGGAPRPGGFRRAWLWAAVLAALLTPTVAAAKPRKPTLDQILERPDRGAPAPPMATRTPAADARPADLVALPWDGGSVSLGLTNRGYLLHPQKLPTRGTGYRLFAEVPGRGLQYGTDELVRAIERAAATVADKHPGVPLRVGNLSRDVGGPIPFSASHNAGRDVDFLFYLLDAKGAPAQPDEFILLNCNGASDDGRYRFDTARNWALVEALLADPTIEVQFLFVSHCLKRLLLDHARATGAPRQLRARAEQVLWRPTDSRAHRDHFHLRIYCAPDDRAAGCEDDGKVWEWAHNHPDQRAKAVARLRRQLQHRNPKERLQALTEVWRGAYGELALPVLKRLADDDAEVRARARDATAVFLRDARLRNDVLARLQAYVRTPSGVGQFEAALTLLAFAEDASAAWRFEAVLRGDYAALHALKPNAATRLRLRRIAAAALATTARARSVDVLLAVVEDRATDDGLRRIADDSLMRYTNLVLPARTKRPAERAAAYRAWWAKHATQPRTAWLRRGFAKSGLVLPTNPATWEAAPTLIEAVGRPAPIGDNAHALLQRMGRGPKPCFHADPKVRAERWRAWWWGGQRWQALRLQGRKDVSAAPPGRDVRRDVPVGPI